VLIDGLPPESLTKTAIRDSLTDEQLDAAESAEPEGHGPWSRLEHLTARVADLLAQVQHTLVLANGGKGKPPTPIPRPGVGPHRRRLTPAGHAYLQRLRARHRQYQHEQHGGG
jgi:hypothetical protein